MKIVGVIPARYQSSRFPGKPLCMINNHPMIWWVYKQAQKVKSLSEIVVATDDDRIYENCKQNNINVVMTSNHHKTGTDRIGEVSKKIVADFYINIQGDEPLIEPETIQQIVDYKMKFPEVEVINTMTRLYIEKDIISSTVVKVVANENDDLIYLSRAPIPYPKKGNESDYYKHLGIYGMSYTALNLFARMERTKNEMIEDIEMLRFIDSRYPIKIISVESNSIGVDCPEDLMRVEEVMKNKAF